MSDASVQPEGSEWVVIREGPVAALTEVQGSLELAGIDSRVVAPPGCDPTG